MSAARRMIRMRRKIVKRLARSIGMDLAPRRSMSFPGYSNDRVSEVSFESVLRAFIAGRPEAFIVQIGAHDGRSDPIWGIVSERKLRGLLVEPQENLFEELRKNYAGNDALIFERAALATADGTTTLFKVDSTFWNENGLPPGIGTQIASLDAKQISKHVSRFGGEGLARREQEYLVRESVPTLTFRSLLAKHGIESVDILQIDTEGFDYEVLKMIDWSETTPSIVQFEHTHLSDRDRLAAWKMLDDLGYALFLSEGINTVGVQGRN